MVKSDILLRMLEPAVRPVGVGSREPSAPGRRGERPFESASFEALLDQAKATDGSGAQPAEDEADAEPGPNVLSPLSDLDAIGNASLRKLIASRGEADKHEASLTPP